MHFKVLLQPKRFDIHVVHKAIESLKVEPSEVSISIGMVRVRTLLRNVLNHFNATEVDLLRHVSKLIEKASQKMKVVGQLAWLSTKCPSHSVEVKSCLEVSCNLIDRIASCIDV